MTPVPIKCQVCYFKIAGAAHDPFCPNRPADDPATYDRMVEAGIGNRPELPQDMNLPLRHDYRPDVDLENAELASGVIVAALTIGEHDDGGHRHPAVLVRFRDRLGKMGPATVLAVPPAELQSLKVLVNDAVDRAISFAAEQNQEGR